MDGVTYSVTDSTAIRRLKVAAMLVNMRLTEVYSACRLSSRWGRQLTLAS